MLGAQQAVGVAPLDDELGGRDTGLGAFGDVVDLALKATPLGPTPVHAQQHLGPVLRVGATRARLDRAHRITLVVLAGEQRPQFEFVEALLGRVDRLADLGFDRIVAFFFRQLEQRRRVVDAPFELFVEVDVVDDLGQLGLHLRARPRCRPRGRVAPSRLRVAADGRATRRGADTPAPRPSARAAP